MGRCRWWLVVSIDLDKAVTDMFYCFIIPFKYGFVLSLLATARWLIFFAQPFRLDEVAYFWDVSWSLEGCTMYLLLDFAVDSTGQQYHHNVERRRDSSPEQLLVKGMLARLRNDTRLPQLKIKSILISGGLCGNSGMWSQYVLVVM